MPTVARHFLIGAGLIILQWLVLERLRIFGVYPDVVILFIAWIGLRHGRQYGALTGFLTGLALDALHDTWGVQMLVKTLVGFLVGLFPASERETLIIQPQQAFFGALAVALLHNGLHVILLALETGARSSFMILGLWIGGAVYTAVLAVMAAFIWGRY